MKREKRLGFFDDGGSSRPPIQPAGRPSTIESIEKDTIKDWVDLFYLYNPHLSSFEISEHTKTISQFIPIETLRRMTRTYRIILQFQKEKYRGNIAIMRNEIKEITSHLGKLERKGWLNPSDKKELLEQLNVKIMGTSRQGIQFIRDQIKGKSTGRPKDVALNALIYVLCKRMERATGMPQYKVAMQFLEEQKIMKQWRGDEDSFKKRFLRVRVNPVTLEEQYERVRDSAIITFFLSPQRNLKPELSDYFADRFIPPFESFLL